MISTHAEIQNYENGHHSMFHSFLRIIGLGKSIDEDRAKMRAIADKRHAVLNDIHRSNLRFAVAQSDGLGDYERLLERYAQVNRSLDASLANRLHEPSVDEDPGN